MLSWSASGRNWRSSDMAFLPIFDALTPAINKVLSFIPDPQQKLEAQHQLMGDLMAWDSQQTQINAVEAANSNLFVSGWRPFIGWTCGVAYAYAFVLQPLMTFGFTAFGHPVTLPTLGLAELSPVLLGMLGLGGMRTFEKMKGI